MKNGFKILFLLVSLCSFAQEAQEVNATSIYIAPETIHTGIDKINSTIPLQNNNPTALYLAPNTVFHHSDDSYLRLAYLDKEVLSAPNLIARTAVKEPSKVAQTE